MTWVNKWVCLAWALQNLSKEEVDEIFDDEDSINPNWSGKKDHETVKWYQAAQSLRSKDGAEEIEKPSCHLEHGDNSVLACV